MAIKLPSGHGNLLSTHCGAGPELGARRSGCARDGNQHVMQHRERGTERAVAAGMAAANSFQGDCTLPFPFLHLTGMLGRNSPYAHSIDQNTKAQERKVTCPR